MNHPEPDDLAELESTAIRNFQVEKLLLARESLNAALHALASAGDIDAELLALI